MKIFILLTTLFLASCATNYQGTVPDLKLKGAAAQAEFERFRLEGPNFILSDRFALRMGEERTRYAGSSLLDVLKTVSPAAETRAEMAYDIGYFGLGALGVAAIYAVAVGTANNSASLAIPFWELLGIGIGAGLYTHIELGAAAVEFNN